MVQVVEGRDLSPEEAADYDDFVAKHPLANIYHTLAWHAVIRETYRYSPVYLLVTESGETRGVLPLFLVRGLRHKRLVSLPFSHHVPVLATGDGALESLLEAAETACRQMGCDYVAIRHGSELPNRGRWDNSNDNYISTLELGRPIDDIWQQVDSKSARWAVNRARRDGVEIEDGQNGAAYDAFYRLELQTRRRQAMPVYPPQFFSSLRSRLAAKELSQVMLARLGGRIVAGIILLSFNGTVIYGYAASINDRQALRSQPMDLLVWEAIRGAHDDGAVRFDFGSTPCFHRGLLSFKEKWGARSSLLPYYDWAPSGRRRSVNRRGLATRAVGAALQRLPDGAYIWASKLIMREIG